MLIFLIYLSQQFYNQNIKYNSFVQFENDGLIAHKNKSVHANNERCKHQTLRLRPTKPQLNI